MKKAQALAPTFVRTFKISSLAAATALAVSTPAHAVQFETDSGWSGSWDTTISYGIGVRMEERDEELFGIANGGKAGSVNGDDGNLNFDKGDVFSNALKLSTELELSKGRYGAFFRVNALYDDVIANDKVDDRPLQNVAIPGFSVGKKEFSDDAVDLAGERIELFDAYLFGEFDAGERFGSWKLGNQVLSWGESTFIQNSINSVNPIDVSKLRVPGSELKEALIPVPLASGTLELTDNTSMEMFYQLKWEPYRIDPTGSYFSTNDFAGEGGGEHGVLVGFGQRHESFTGAVISRAEDNEPQDGSQFGLAYRVFAPSLNDTEFGFFFMNYHSRLPVVSAVTADDTRIAFANGAATFDEFIGRLGTSNPLVPGQKSQYVVEYPEDIQLYGVSFNTSLGKTGIALQGEISHKQDVPLQLDDVELLLAAIGSASNSAACTSPLCGAAGAGGLAAQSRIGTAQPGEVLLGYRQKDVTQFQTTATKAFGNVMGADRLILIGEAGFNYVHDFEDKNERSYEVNGTDYTSNTGSVYVGTLAGVGAVPEETGAFADNFSWGYIVAGRLEYSDVFAGINLKPTFSYSQDVKGNSPGPGGSFIEDRKSASLGLNFDYQQKWSGGLSYTAFMGAGKANLISDRDFMALNAKYSF